MYLAVECTGSFNRLLGGKRTQIDLFHSEETIPIPGIFYLIDSPKAPLSHRHKHTVTLFEQWFFRRSTQRCFANETTLCLALVGCTTVIAVEWRRKCHTCSTFSKSSFAIYFIVCLISITSACSRLRRSPDLVDGVEQALRACSTPSTPSLSWHRCGSP